MGKMAALNENSVVKRFHNVSSTQDSIQSLSLWVIHHKAHHERIVELWFKVLKKAKISQRLTLMYLCNDIVQTCKRKHAIVYKDAFKEMLKDAVLLVRDSSIRKNVERIFTIWEERKVYDGEYITELKAALDQAQPAAAFSSRLLAEFQPSTVVAKIRSLSTLERESEQKRSQLNLTRIDALNTEAVKQLKDRAHGKEFSQQFEDTCVKLEDYIGHVEREMKEGQTLIELLEQGQLFYDAQYGEAKIVANAYKNFGTRVNNLKRRLEEHSKTLPSPVPSPTPEAPSPGNTPPKLRETLDNIEAIDMELSDDDENGIFGERRRESTVTTGSYLQPIASVTEILMKQSKPYSLTDNHSPKSDDVPSPKGSPIGIGSPIGMSPTKPNVPAYASFLNDVTNASFLANASKNFSLTDSPKPIPTLGSVSKAGLEDFLGGGDSTPVRDEKNEEEGRAGTPVMDEALESVEQSMVVPSLPPAPPMSMPRPQMASHMPQLLPPPPPPMMPSLPPEDDAAADNPMEFLTQLIIHHQAQKKGNKDTKNEFLQSLSEMAKPKSSESSSKMTDSWGSWNDQPAPTPPVSMSMSVPPPTSLAHRPLPAPPPPPPTMPMPPRPPIAFHGTLPTPPVQNPPRMPLTPQSPQVPPPNMSVPPPSSPFPGPPPPRPPTNFNNGLNQWNTPPPPPPPSTSAQVSQGYESGPNFQSPPFNNPPPQPFSSQSQGFNAQGSQGFNSQNSQGYNNQRSRNYDPEYDPQGYDDQDYESHEFDNSQEYNDDGYNAGPRGKSMPRFARPNHNNLTTIQTQDFASDNANDKGPGVAPLIRPLMSPGMVMRGPRPPPLHMPSPRAAQDSGEEFQAMLKRQASVTSPTTPGGGNIRTLTEITTQDSEDMDLDEGQDDQEINEDEGNPIASLPVSTRLGPQRLLGDGPRPTNTISLRNIMHRPRMPGPERPPFRGQFDSRDNYARRDLYREPFRRDPFMRDGFRPKRMPPPMRGGYFPRY